MGKDKYFSLDVSPEEGIILLAGLKLLDKLVEGISIQSKEGEQLITRLALLLESKMPVALTEMSEEIAEAIVESLVGESIDTEHSIVETFIEETDAPINYPMYSTENTLPHLEDAVINHKTVKVEYYSFTRESIDQLNLDPLAIVKERGMWKTIAYCQEMDEIMLFRIDRIKTLKITDHSFEMPPNIRKISELRFAS